MSDETYQNELHFKSSSNILGIIKKFSATEKVVFGALVILAGITAIAMALRASDNFKVEVPAYGGTLKEGLVGLPRTINPVLAITDADRDIGALVYSGLMKYDGQKLLPDLATGYTVSTDGLTYDFRMRGDAHFQDGTPVTADDVEFTIQKIQDVTLKSPRRADWQNVSVKKISPNEIQFILKQPYSPFLANTVIGILPKHIWSSISDEQFIFSQYNVDPIGSGPYKVDSIGKDGSGIPTEYKLSSWDDYYSRKPYISTIIFSLFADSDKAFAAIDQGSIDSLAAVPSDEAAKLASDEAQAYIVLSSPLPRIFSAFFNQNQAKVLADKNVRTALGMVVDRSLIIQNVLLGYGSPLTGPLPPGMFSSSSDTVATGTIGTAKALLENNGWKQDATGVYVRKAAKNASTTLAFSIYTADSDDLRKTAQILANAWNALGAKVDVKTFSSSDLYQNVIRPRKYDVLLFGQQIGRDRDLYAFWHSSQMNAPGLNVAMYANAKVDKVLEDIRSTNDDGKRTADYAALDQLITADDPAIFLYAPDFTYVVPKDLKGIVLNTVTVPSDRFDNIADWYLNTEKVWKIFTK